MPIQPAVVDAWPWPRRAGQLGQTPSASMEWARSSAATSRSTTAIV